MAKLKHNVKQHYMGRGLMKHYKSAADMAKDTGMPLKNVESTFAAYNETSIAKKDPFGKKFFHNLPFVPNDEFWVAIVTPVLHFTMGACSLHLTKNISSCRKYRWCSNQ